PLDPDTSGKTLAMEQARLGLEHSRSQLILIPEEFKIEDIKEPSYAEFMRALRQQSRAADRLEIVQTDRYQMLDEILAKQQKLEEQAGGLEEGVKGGGEVAFIDLHMNDVSYATELVGYLSQHKITPVMIPASDLTPSSSMSLFEENLKRSDLFIVVFGTVA